jgi:O-antigen/teichoic acid export membrane protein
VSADRPVELRRRVARGTLVNALFLTFVNVLAFVRGFLVAAFLTRAEYGVWGLLLVVLTTLLWFRSAGIGEKFVQQDEHGEEQAFARALTLELIAGGAFLLAAGVLIPVIALVLDQPSVVAPGLVLALVLPAQALQTPLWIFYRRLDYVRQRKLEAVDPIAGTVVAVALAAAGAGYWSLVIGAVAGAWAGAVAALLACPYRLRLRFDRATALSYAKFSGPMLLAGATPVVMGQGLVLVSEATLGLAGVGAIALAATIAQFAGRVDQVITTTLYPAICAVQDRLDVLRESFAKSNRMAMLWGVPFGVGLALFAEDLVDYGLGPEWREAVVLMQALGVVAAVRQIAFNWDAFYRARGDSRPTGVGAIVAMSTFLAIAVPLLAVAGLEGLAVAYLIMEAISLAVRGWYVRRLFPRFSLVAHALRGAAPTLLALPPVLLLRATAPAERTLGLALAELAAYVVLVAVVTAVTERRLIREMLSYLGRVPAPGPST